MKQKRKKRRKRRRYSVYTYLEALFFNAYVEEVVRSENRSTPNSDQDDLFVIPNRNMHPTT